MAIKSMMDPIHQSQSIGGADELTVRGNGASPLVGSAQDIR